MLGEVRFSVPAVSVTDQVLFIHLPENLLIPSSFPLPEALSESSSIFSYPSPSGLLDAELTHSDPSSNTAAGWAFSSFCRKVFFFFFFFLID